MSWQERIERYQQEQAQLQSEAKRKRREEQEQEKQRRVEKIKPLLQALEDLRCREMLTQIRDEIWKLGEVTVSPDLGSVTHETPIEARATLIAKWPYLGKVSHSEGPMSEERTVTREEEVIQVEVLAIKIFWNKEGKLAMCRKGKGDHKGEGPAIYIDENAPSELERLLAEDCLYRQKGDPFFASDRGFSPYGSYGEVERKDTAKLERWKGKH